MTSNNYYKKAVRARMAAAGENYLTAARFVDEKNEETRFGSEWWDEDLQEVMGELYAGMDFFARKFRTGEPDLSDALDDYVTGSVEPFYAVHYGVEWDAAFRKEMDDFNADLDKLAAKYRVSRVQVDEAVQSFMKISGLNDYLCDCYGYADE